MDSRASESSYTILRHWYCTQVKANVPGVVQHSNAQPVVEQQAAAALKPSMPVVDLTNDDGERATKRQRV